MVLGVLIVSTALQTAGATITFQGFDRMCYDPGDTGTFRADITNNVGFTMYVVGASLTINGVGMFSWNTAELQPTKEVSGRRAEAIEDKQVAVISIPFKMPNDAALHEYETVFAVFYRSRSMSLDILQYDQAFPQLMMCGAGPLHPAVIYTLYALLIMAATALFFFPSIKRISRNTAHLVKILSEAFLVVSVVWSVIRILLVGTLDYFVVVMIAVVLFETGYWRQELGVDVNRLLGIMAATLSVMLFAMLVFRVQFAYFFMFLISVIEMPVILTCTIEAIEHHGQKGTSWPSLILTASAIPFVILALAAVGLVATHNWVLSIQVVILIVAAVAVLVATAAKYRETWYAKGHGEDNLEQF